MADDHNRLDDERLFELLDRYVAALHAGDATQCARWLEQYPELRALAKCLEALDEFSAARAPNVTPAGSLATATAPFAPTIVGEGSSFSSVAGEAPSAVAGDFGKFELLDEIGRGGMGVVFKARQRDLNRVVALKMILSSRLAAVEDVKRFYREARAAGSLRHPHIVGIHEVGQIHGQHYFAMDFIAGSSLAAVTKNAPVDPDRAARWLSGVARAVQFLHDHGIVHRDLKPSNILLDESGTAYVTDVGMTGPYDSVIGVRKDNIVERFLTGRPVAYSVAENGVQLRALIAEVDEKTGRARAVERLTLRPDSAT